MHAHYLDSNEPIAPAALAARGVLNRQLPLEPSEFQEPLDALKAEGGYTEQDEVRLSPETPNLEALCAKFEGEHRHDEDEVRFVLEGEGVFEIRAEDERWMRVTVSAGDLIVVPKDRYHRFYLSDARNIRCVRLFQDAAGWVPHYR